MVFALLKLSAFVVLNVMYLYTVSRKKGATDFFAVTFTNIDGFS